MFVPKHPIRSGPTDLPPSGAWEPLPLPPGQVPLTRASATRIGVRATARRSRSSPW